MRLDVGKIVVVDLVVGVVKVNVVSVVGRNVVIRGGGIHAVVSVIGRLVELGNFAALPGMICLSMRKILPLNCRDLLLDPCWPGHDPTGNDRLRHNLGYG